MEHPSGHLHFRLSITAVMPVASGHWADDATTPAVSQHWNELAFDYEQLAERVEETSSIADQYGLRLRKV
jgi:hypothetical protein